MLIANVSGTSFIGNIIQINHSNYSECRSMWKLCNTDMSYSTSVYVCMHLDSPYVFWLWQKYQLPDHSQLTILLLNAFHWLTANKIVKLHQHSKDQRPTFYIWSTYGTTWLTTNLLSLWHSGCMAERKTLWLLQIVYIVEHYMESFLTLGDFRSLLLPQGKDFSIF